MNSEKKKKARVLCFTSRFPRWEGDSVCNFVYYLARELTKYYEVFVLAPHDAHAKDQEIMEGIRVHRFTYFLPRRYQALSNEHGLMANVRKSFLSKMQVAPFLFTEWRALLRLVKQERIDVVNSHWIVPQGLVAAAAKQTLPFHHLVTIHAGDIFALRRWPAGAHIARFIVRHTDNFFTVSQLNRQVLEELVGHKVPAQVLPMGVDTQYFIRRNDVQSVREKLHIPFQRVILFVGRLSEKKGIQYLIRAMKNIDQQIGGAGLVVVGSGPLDQQLRGEVKALGLSETIQFVGSKDHAQLRDYYAAADVTAVPSIVDSSGDTEGVPVVVLESLSTGTPVVATRVGGIPEVIVDGYNGYLVEQKDSQALAHALIDFFENGQAMADNALITARKYDWTAIGLGYKRMIDSMINEKTAGITEMASFSTQ
ncbi:MAG: glycosyltransferase [candidate division KSB1 bacterium]|nr:glycosyltransferase [candidate division KSB1 bacterium]MDZ7303597.1 glycosyltransferase [candidate division KSB1 bacterium]